MNRRSWTYRAGQRRRLLRCIYSIPGSNGSIQDRSKIVDSIHGKKGIAVFASDLLALCLLKPPGEMGADIVVGSSQRFGVPLGCGGPHAAFMSVKEDVKGLCPEG